MMLAVLALVVGCASGSTAPPVSASAPTVTSTPEPLTSSPPEPELERRSSPVVPAVGPLQLRYGDDPAQFGWLHLPERPGGSEVTVQKLPVVVLVHGGFWAEPWDYTLMSDLAEGVAAEGLAVWNIEFRRLRGRGGWTGTFDDVRAAIDHLAILGDAHPLDLDSVLLVGHSSGGHLALWAARDDVVTEPEVRGAIGLAAITDLGLTTASIGLLGGTPSEVPDRWIAAAPSLDPTKVTLLHGDQDATVPVFAVDNAVEAGVHVDVISNADHRSLITRGGVGFYQVVAAIVERASVRCISSDPDC